MIKHCYYENDITAFILTVMWMAVPTSFVLGTGMKMAVIIDVDNWLERGAPSQQLPPPQRKNRNLKMHC
eukprot:scaffold150083_cov26-Cyclotella_meneghiniana.AAC.1